MGWLQQVTIANYTGSPTSPVSARPQIVESRAYDPAGRLARVTDAMGRSTHTYYNDDDTVSEIDADGFHNFDPVAQAFDGTERNVILQQNTYDAAGNLTQRVTGGGKTTVANTWDAAGRATSTTVDPGGLNRTSSNAYDAVGNVVRSTITDGTQTRETDFTYDVAGNVTAQTAKNPPQDSTTTFTYDQRGLPLTRTSPNGNVSGANPAAYTVGFLHDEAGQQVVTTEPPTATTTFNPATGQPLTLTVAPETRTGYNTFSESAETKDPTGNITTTTHTFDATGEHLAVASNTYTAPDASGTFTAVTRTDFDAMGRPEVLTDAKGNTATNIYDQLGNLVEKDLPSVGGTARKWLDTYDLDGEKQSITDPSGAQTLSTYDDLGRTVTLTDGVTISSSYDAAGHLTSQAGSGGEAATPTRTVAYDADGRITSLSTPRGTQAYTYEDRGAIASASGPMGTSTYTYDAEGRLASRADTADTTTFTYDTAGQLKTLADPQTGSTLAYSYTPTGRVAAIQYGTGNTRSYTYDDQGNVTTDSVKTSTGAAVSSLAYTYYPSGRLKTQTTTGLAGATTHTYGYDAAGRLSTWNNGAATTAYAYDGNGNLTSNGTTTATYNQRNQLSTAGTTTYTYTARGTRSAATTGTTTTSATYDAFDELTSQGGQTYTYDALGRLTTSAGHTFTYDATSNNLTSDGTENYTRTPTGGLTAIGTPAGAAFAYSDRHGNLVATFTATGTTTAGTSAYDPWGKPTATAGTTHNLGYQSGWTDPTSGQISTASRWYDPATADFTSRDTANLAPITAAGANRYAYGAGDPLTNADPTGHNPCELGGASPDDDPAGGGSGDSAAASAPAPAYAGMSASAWERKAQHMADVESAEAAELKAAYNRMSYGESSAGQEAAGSWWVNYKVEFTKRLKRGYGYGGAGAGAAGLAQAEAMAEAEAMAMEFELAAGYSSCDTDGAGPPPPPRHHKFPPPPPRNDQPPAVDPHNIDPVPCTHCSTPTPQGTPLNGPEAGPTQQGTPQAVHSGPGSPFAPGSLPDPLTNGGPAAGSLFGPGASGSASPSSSGATQDELDGLVQRCEYWFGRTESDCRQIPVMVVDGKKTPKIAINDQSAIDSGQPFLLHALRNEKDADRNRELAGCKSAWQGPQSCDEYPFASTYEGGIGAQTMGVPVAEQRIQGPDISGFYSRKRIKRGDEFMVLVINVKRYGGVYHAG
ncbi:NucA/NucB deoxyribonuclease domain-containing protein [Kitasatospora sp. NPDC001159]